MNKHFKYFIVCVLLTLFASLACAESQSKSQALISNSELEALGIRVSETPSRDLPGYRKIKRMLISQAPPEMATRLTKFMPGIEFTFLSNGDTPEGPYEAVAGLGGEIMSADTAVWIHAYTAGVDRIVTNNSIIKRQPILTNSSGTAAPTIAEHAIAMMLMHSRQLHQLRDQQHDGVWLANQGLEYWSVSGKTMLVLGLGAIGKQIAQRADALGMRVIAVRNSSREGPDYVDYVGLSHETLTLASQADVVVNALPLTPSTRGLINDKFFQAMKSTAIVLSIGRGATIDTDDLITALNKGQIAGAGLDVTDPEPLPDDHPLWDQPNVIITPHIAGRGTDLEIIFRLLMENIRRYQLGEPLLNMVNIEAGY